MYVISAIKLLNIDKSAVAELMDAQRRWQINRLNEFMKKKLCLTINKAVIRMWKYIKSIKFLFKIVVNIFPSH
jgi:hypothetical protein